MYRALPRFCEVLFAFAFLCVCVYIYIHTYTFNLQTVLFRPLRSHQCSLEWFENWDMSTAQRAINTSHTDKQWHILFLNTKVYIYIYIVFAKQLNSTLRAL